MQLAGCEAFQQLNGGCVSNGKRMAGVALGAARRPQGGAQTRETETALSGRGKRSWTREIESARTLHLLGGEDGEDVVPYLGSTGAGEDRLPLAGGGGVAERDAHSHTHQCVGLHHETVNITKTNKTSFTMHAVVLQSDAHSHTHQCEGQHHKLHKDEHNIHDAC